MFVGGAQGHRPCNRLFSIDWGWIGGQVGRNQDPLLDAACLLAVRKAVGPAVELRADANRSWDRAAAIAFGRAATDAHLAFIEEPVTDPLIDLSAFHGATGISVALDESLDCGAVTVLILLPRLFSQSRLALSASV